jgi:hypothetical protein
MRTRKITLPDSYRTQTRIDGWLGSDPQSIPPAIAEIMAGNFPPISADDYSVAAVRQRMLRRQREHDRKAGRYG